MTPLRFLFSILLLCLLLTIPDVLSFQAKIVAGFDDAFAPFEYIDDQGVQSGYNYALIKHIEARNKWRVQYVFAEWSQVRADFDSGKVHILAGMINTEARREKYAFSAPHLYIHYSIFQRKRHRPIVTWEELNDVNILIQSGDVIEEIVAEKNPHAHVIRVPNYHIALDKLAEGTGEIAILPRILGYNYMLSHKLNNLEINTALDFAYPYCMAVLPKHQDLLIEIDKTLIKMQADGSLQELKRKWFSSDYDTNQAVSSFTRKHLYLFFTMIGCILAFAISMLFYHRRLLTRSTDNLKRQIKDKEAANRELSMIHNLYQKGVIVVMKWYDIEKEHFNFITENISAFGYNAADLITGRIHYSDIIHPDDIALVTSESAKNVACGLDSFQQSYRILCPSNEVPTTDNPSITILKQRNYVLSSANSLSVRWVLDNTVLIHDKEKDIRVFYGYLLDITDIYESYYELSKNRKLAESAENAKDIFLSSITDEISMPIISLNEAITKLTYTGLTEEQQDSLMKLHSSAYRLRHVIDHIQSYLYYSNKAIDSQYSWIDINSFIELHTKLFHARAETKDMFFHFHPCPTDVEINYNPVYLRDILRIICDNAIKFSNQGNIDLYVLVERQTETKLILCLLITDEGIGIPNEKLEFIFKPFTQIDDSYTRERGGLGLGLAILKQIINISSGTVNIQNRDSKGVELMLKWSCDYRILSRSKTGE